MMADGAGAANATTTRTSFAITAANEKFLLFRIDVSRSRIAFGTSTSPVASRHLDPLPNTSLARTEYRCQAARWRRRDAPITERERKKMK